MHSKDLLLIIPFFLLQMKTSTFARNINRSTKKDWYAFFFRSFTEKIGTIEKIAFFFISSNGSPENVLRFYWKMIYWSIMEKVLRTHRKCTTTLDSKNCFYGITENVLLPTGKCTTTNWKMYYWHLRLSKK